jgi:GTP cyclohydrolase II
MDRFGIFCFHCHGRPGDQLHITLDMIGSEGSGVLVYLPQEGRGIGLVEKIRA